MELREREGCSGREEGAMILGLPVPVLGKDGGEWYGDGGNLNLWKWLKRIKVDQMIFVRFGFIGGRLR